MPKTRKSRKFLPAKVSAPKVGILQGSGPLGSGPIGPGSGFSVMPFERRGLNFAGS